MRISRKSFSILQILAEPFSYKGLILSSITIVLVVIHSSRISIHYEGQAESYLEPHRATTLELFINYFLWTVF